MIIKYNFLSKLAGETPTVEVSDDLGKKMEQMALDEYNLDRAETRRHTYMSQLEENGHYIADDRDPLDDILEAELHEALMAAIEKLQPQQKELLIRVYWNKELQKDIAAEEGVSPQAIASRIKTILKNFLK